MRLNEFDDSLSRADLDQLEVFADKVFGKVGIDVNFTRHFLDRVNDERNIKQITKGELTRLFKQEAKRWAKPIARLGPDAEGTMKDLQTQINLPFVLVWDQNNQELDLIAKTVMRKKDFKTRNTEFPVESLTEGDGAFQGVGPIHISEITPTLQALEKVLGIDLLDNALGSVGKKEFSGDIDVALKIPTDEIPAFYEKLKTIPEIIDTSKSSVIMTKVKIHDYDESKEGAGKQRTGFVQVDFMPGDPDWMKVYYHSPHEGGMSDDGRSSKYKGMHRNIMIASIAAVHNRKNSGDEISKNRYEETEMFMFSSRDGLVRVTRTPVPRKDGKGFTAKNQNKIIGGPWKTTDEIADVLNLGSGEALYSFETLFDAVKQNFADEERDMIFTNFSNNSQIAAQGMPDEVANYAK
jgi:hypothetical protein